MLGVRSRHALGSTDMAWRVILDVLDCGVLEEGRRGGVRTVQAETPGAFSEGRGACFWKPFLFNLPWILR